MKRDKNGLTMVMRECLERIYRTPEVVLKGPNLAIANKLWKMGLVEKQSKGIFRLTEEGRRVLDVGLSKELQAKIEAEVVMILHAHRDCLRNQKQDTSKVTFDVRDGYYGEAFGVMRAMVLLGYISWGASNIPGNANSWMHELESRVLREENYNGSNECDHCFNRYGHDGAGRTRSTQR